MQGVFLRKYGVQATIDFQLFETDGINFKVDAVHAAGDTKLVKDEGSETNTSNGFVDKGQGYSITLTAIEMQAGRIVVYIVDQETKEWLDTCLIIETYGNASAQHAFDLSSENAKANIVQCNGNTVAAGAIPDAAAGANGGLPTVDANNRIAGIQGTISNLNNLDVSVSSRLASSGYTAPDNTNIVNIHDIVKAGGTGDCAAIKNQTANVGKAAKMLVNKAVQDKLTGRIKYYDDDGQTVVLIHTPEESEAEITRMPS